MAKKQQLTPPDPKQCQAEKPNGHSFMTLGGIPGHVRCSEKPAAIVYETKEGADGLKGSMSLCDSCLNVALKQLGNDFFRIERLFK